MPYPRDKRQMNRYAGAFLLSLLVTSLFAFPNPSFSQDILKIVDSLEKVFPDKEKEKYSYQDWMDKFKLAGKFLKEIELERRDLKLALAVGFNGNRAGEDNNFHKLDVAANIRRGGYPNQLRFIAETSVLYEDNALREDVRTMLVNYDYHVLPSLETYGFVERFSNSYMSIQQRYEIGVGLKYGFELFGLSSKKAKQVNSYKNNSKSYKEFKDYIEKSLTRKNSKAEKDALLKQLEEIKIKEEEILTYTKKEYSRLALGLATSFFIELEQAELETIVTDQNNIEDTAETNSTQKFYESDQFLRWSIRPSVTIRITEHLILDGMVYWKYRVVEPVQPNGDLDFRRDVILKATLAIPKTTGWADKVSLIFEYRQHFDNIPPFLSKDSVNEYLEEGKDLSPIPAERRHHQFKFMINVKF